MKRSLSTGVFMITLITTATVYCYKMAHDEQYRAVHIQASREGEESLPVYAQFKVTQTLKLDEVARVTRINVPISVPTNMGLMDVVLRQKEKEIGRWQLSYQYFDSDPGIKETVLEIRDNRWLAGEVEIEFDGSAIAHADKAIAPG